MCAHKHSCGFEQRAPLTKPYECLEHHQMVSVVSFKGVTHDAHDSGHLRARYKCKGVSPDIKWCGSLPEIMIRGSIESGTPLGGVESASASDDHSGDLLDAFSKLNVSSTANTSSTQLQITGLPSVPTDWRLKVKIRPASPLETASSAAAPPPSDGGSHAPRPRETPSVIEITGGATSLHSSFHSLFCSPEAGQHCVLGHDHLRPRG
jgi:hypothetical protein